LCQYVVEAQSRCVERTRAWGEKDGGMGKRYRKVEEVREKGNPLEEEVWLMISRVRHLG
jgi:hypothetical protein